MIDGEEVEDGVYKIKDMVEKPPFAEAPSDLAIIGRYVLTPDIFDEIETDAAPAPSARFRLLTRCDRC